MKKIVIAGELIDLNVYTRKQRANRFGGASVKKQYTNICSVAVKKAMSKGLKVEDEDYPLDISINWYVTSKRKDKDNIAFAKKFIFDGMIKAGLIENDGWKQIGDFEDNFFIDKENPRVEVILNARTN